MTNGAWLSPIQIVDCSLLGVSLDIDLGAECEGADLTLTVNTAFEHSEGAPDDFLCRSIIGVSANWTDNRQANNETVFSASCKVGLLISMSASSFDADISEEDRSRFLEANSVSLAYGKIRAVVEDLTAQSVVGKQTLPAIDPFALLESFSKE